MFAERAGFPANRSELYEEGLDVLLKKWDAKRNIKRDEAYKQLSLKRKEDLLSQVAWITFEQSDYFFKKKFVEEQIQEYIRNLPNASSDLEALQLDSEAVLNSIVAQHGLLVERARGIYSFSHLTFLEYFTARQFKEKADDGFSGLVVHITDKQWREVFLLTAGMLINADKLLQAIKIQIDKILAKDLKLQKFLSWLEQKSFSTKSIDKPANIRSHYLVIECFYHRGSSLDYSLEVSRNLSLKKSSVTINKIPDWRSNQFLGISKADAQDFERWNQKKFVDWHFNISQEILLKQYIDANKLLVDCLNSDCYVSREADCLTHL